MKSRRGLFAFRILRSIRAVDSLTLPFSAMRTRLPIISAIVSGLTAFATVWCMGCCAFDPILATMFGKAPTAVSCESAMGPTSGSSSGAGVMSIRPFEARDSVCGCTSCYSVSPPPLVSLGERVPTPRAEPLRLNAPVTAARAPLAPPPEIGTL